MTNKEIDERTASVAKEIAEYLEAKKDLLLLSDDEFSQLLNYRGGLALADQLAAIQVCEDAAHDLRNVAAHDADAFERDREERQALREPQNITNDKIF